MNPYLHITDTLTSTNIHSLKHKVNYRQALRMLTCLIKRALPSFDLSHSHTPKQNHIHIIVLLNFVLLRVVKHEKIPRMIISHEWIDDPIQIKPSCKHPFSIQRQLQLDTNVKCWLSLLPYSWHLDIKMSFWCCILLITSELSEKSLYKIMPITSVHILIQLWSITNKMIPGDGYEFKNYSRYDNKR